ncbi:helix-turn-helix transcriptional regulator [Aquabacterium sp. OR-4]|uniref:helix-turn-helix transcriptional regulator n=1 Tax=Aquabacterium sp. OR-4 TaxID=2978127 RepID=UPI0021B32DCD|nr:helix-turn-helix transcriptional regulator [Aquabacterium sp. OR-4]MDT7838050.1 helix-turn-helix transcriptional regulator [Aquabacterium sp. OR-4]
MTTDPVIHSGETRHLARSLRSWRALRRIKQEHAARLLGVSQPTLSRWENGRAAPDADEAQRLRQLLAARLDSAADHMLGRLVRQSREPVHLICDLTHRLLAASPLRQAQFHVPLGDLLGRALWRYASEDIVRAEGQLAERGWYEPAPPAISFDTGARHSDALSILPCHMRWVRLQLSDGSHVRLVESIDERPLPGLVAGSAGPAADQDPAPG